MTTLRLDLLDSNEDCGGSFGISDNSIRKKNFFDFEDEESVFSDSISSSPPQHQALKQSSINAKNVPSKTTIAASVKVESSPVNQNESAKKSESFFSDFKFDSSIIKRIDNLIQKNNNGKSSKTIQTAITPRSAIEKIMSGDNYHHNVNLSVFRGKEQKLELLDYALLIGDKYVLTMVILFLRDTLKSSIFLYEIIRRPVAADHYLNHLRSMENFDQLMEVLCRLGRNDEAAFTMYSHSIKKSTEQSAESLLKQLNKSLSNFTSGGLEIIQWQLYIQDQIGLLEQQLPIEADDRRRATEQLRTKKLSDQYDQHVNSDDENNFFVIYQRPCLIGLPLMETLRYCFLYHYQLQENNFASPFYLKKRFGLSDKQFLWIALQVFAQTSRWTEIDKLFEYKSWLGSRKIRNQIPIVEIVETLYRCSAPPEVLEKYLELVDDVERRLQLAKEFHMSKFAADLLIKLRDRKRLSEFRASIQTKLEIDYIQRYIDNALRTSTIKWKN